MQAPRPLTVGALSMFFLDSSRIGQPTQALLQCADECDNDVEGETSDMGIPVDAAPRSTWCIRLIPGLWPTLTSLGVVSRNAPCQPVSRPCQPPFWSLGQPRRKRPSQIQAFPFSTCRAPGGVRLPSTYTLPNRIFNDGITRNDDQGTRKRRAWQLVLI